MKILAICLAITAAITLLTSCGNFNSWQKSNRKTVTIGSGSKSAMFYPVTSAICEVFNKYNQDRSVICKPALSKGAEYNLEAIESGEFDIGIAQANLQHDAYNGLGKFKGKPYKNLRTLFRIHDEYLTIIAKKNSNIKSFADLRGKKVNIGNPGSGSRILFSEMLNRLGWKLSDFKEVYEESGSNINKVLCVPGKADAAIYIVGHPNESFAKMINECDAKLVSLSDKEIEDFIKLSPKEFKKSFIPKNTYEKSQERVVTFASKTILTASTNLDKEFVSNFVSIISEHKDELIKKQPSLSVIDFSLEDDHDLAPLHEGIKSERKL